MSTSRRSLLVLAGLLAALVGTWATGARRAVRRVAPELRGPRLFVSFSWMPLRLLALLRARMRQDIPVAPGVAVRRLSVTSPEGAPVGVVVYDAGSRPAPTGALLWVHGGGHLIGDPGMDHAWCSRVVTEVGVPVVSVDYRLAPEDPYPADLDDCYAGLRWLQAHTDELGVDPGRIAVGGASAGGGLAAALVQRAQDAGHPVCFQLLQYPMLDDRTALVADHAGLADAGRPPGDQPGVELTAAGPTHGGPQSPRPAARARSDAARTAGMRSGGASAA